MLCAVAPAEQVHLQTFNIATGEPIKLNEFAAGTPQATGVTLLPTRLPLLFVWFAAWLCEVFLSHDRPFDFSKARQHLGYRPRLQPRQGIAATVDRYRANGFVIGRFSD